MDTNEINQLAKTFTTACKETVAKTKVKTYTAPILLVALAVLTGLPKGTPWLRL